MALEGTQDSALQRPGRAKVYNRTKLLIGITSSVLSFFFLLLIVTTGLSHTAEVYALAVSASPFVALIVFAFIVGIAESVLTLPLGFISGYVVERRYGLSNQSLKRWAWEHVKGMLVGVPLLLVALIVLYACLERFGNAWWLPAGALFTLFSVLLARLAPVLLFPIFYRFTPLEDGPLKERLSRLCAAAGIAFGGIYTFDLSKNTKKANAGFAGIGRSKRIILGDTLVHDFTEDEIETVFAHELGHYVRHHLLTGIVVGTVSTFLGLFLSSILYEWSLRLVGFTSATELGALPLLAVWLSLFGLVMSPLGNMLSRKHEREADRYAVERTGNAGAFASALRKLAFMNLADPEPHPLVEFFFYSHPSISRRIRAVEGAIS